MEFDKLLSFHQTFVFTDVRNFKLQTAQTSSDTFFWCVPTTEYLRVALTGLSGDLLT